MTRRSALCIRRRHLLSSLPITDNNDVILSDSRGRAAQQPGLWYSKPYSFVPAPELQFECLSAQDMRLAAPGGHGCKAAPSRQIVPMPRPGFAVQGLIAPTAIASASNRSARMASAPRLRHANHTEAEWHALVRGAALKGQHAN